MPNKSQTNGVMSNVSVTLTGSWQRVCGEDPNRCALLFMNLSATNNMGVFWAPPGNAGATPTPAGIGSSGVWTLTPRMSYEPDGGFIPTNELWVIGTNADVLTAMISP